MDILDNKKDKKVGEILGKVLRKMLNFLFCQHILPYMLIQN